MTGREAGKVILLAVAWGWLALPSIGIAQSGSGRSTPGDSDRGSRDDRQIERRERAVERCKSQRGIDCDTPEGRREWLDQERTRREAVKDGSRHRLPPQR